MTSPQGDFSDFQVHRELDQLLGGVVYTAPATAYVGLSKTGSYHLTGVIAEPAPTINIGTDASPNIVSTGYARVAIVNNLTNWPVASGRQKKNGTAITFPVAAYAWGTVVSWFLADAATGGNILASGTLPTLLVVSGGDPALTFVPGSWIFGR